MRRDTVSDRGGWTRRALLGAAVGVVGSIAWRSAAASPEELAAAIRAFAGGAPLRTGRVLLDIAPLVENGNVVPISVKVDSPMTEADHVTAIAVFNERNPQRDVAVFHLGPRAGRAAVATRIRLATSQQLVAVARMNDGSCFMHTVDVIVTLAACVES
ncbi:Sulfur oxidation protein SoxY OS=Rhizobacter sp. Root404 OX=1736528 GN=ASC76_00710 PE=4 SV=1 [Rhizobacter fulvus]|jgi:sulfur-oxidizing protein SoxY